MVQDPKLLVSYLFYWIGDLWSKTGWFQTYGLGYGFYCKMMEWSLVLDTEGVLWKKPEPEPVKKSRRRKNKKKK